MRHRRAWPPSQDDGTASVDRMQKRLFTPEIKRMLKDWLVRRRDNPYPSRDEKKSLAIGSGLTYIQICNWFANWRRKLKNAGREPSKRTWGNLIKNYNTSANGNVEQFSISSNDSIWGDEQRHHQQPQQHHQQQNGGLVYGQHQQQQQHQPMIFHPDYRPTLIGYDDDTNNAMVLANEDGSRTIEYYDRFGELVVRRMSNPAAMLATTDVDGQQVGMNSAHPQLMLPMVENTQINDGYYYDGYYGGTQTAQEQCFQVCISGVS